MNNKYPPIEESLADMDACFDAQRNPSPKRAVRLGELANQGLIGMQARARDLVFRYAVAHLDVTDPHPTFSIDEVYVVWFCKTLQNWKALLSTTLPDGMYYEVTFDGDKEKAYLDAYKKFDNISVSFGEDITLESFSVSSTSLTVNDSPSGVDVKSQYVEPRAW